jgi:hypothetical protein
MANFVCYLQAAPYFQQQKQIYPGHGGDQQPDGLCRPHGHTTEQIPVGPYP